MRIRHKKILVSGAAVTVAGVLGVGTLIQTGLSVQASADMMPGIETIVSENSGEKPFKILELTDSSEKAEIGYYVSGQEPYIKLYTWQYQDEDGTTKTVHFSTLEEGLQKLPENLRAAFAMNVKVDENGNIDENASTGIKKINAISSGDSENSPLTFTQYQEKYFLEKGDSSDSWTQVDFTDAEGNTRTDTVTIKGNYVENTEGTGDYTKGEQVYYPVRNDKPEDESKPEKYRENIQNFYFSEGEDSRGAYFLKFGSVDNKKINEALKKDGGQSSIAPEYDHASGRYGYYENVYEDLTTEIVENIQNNKYTFPGENPETDLSGAVVLFKDLPEAVQDQQNNLFDSGSTGTQTEVQEVQNVPDDGNTGEDFSGGSSFSGNSLADGQISFDNGFEDSTEASDDEEIQTDNGDPGEDISQDEVSEGNQQEDQDTDTADDEFTDMVSTDGQNNGNTSDDFSEDTGNSDISEEADTSSGSGTVEDVSQKGILGDIQDRDKVGTQEDPYVYFSESMDVYPYFRYTAVGDLKYVKEHAVDPTSEEQQGVIRKDGDITLESDQYWYWKEVSGTVTKFPITVITGRQPVAFEDLKEIPEEITYNYYYRVTDAYFCCKSSDEGTKPSDYTFYGWYFPSYPQGQDAYIPVSDGETATYYISDAEYSLTPGTGNYDFQPGGDTEYPVQVNHMFYQGGYRNNDWFRKYVFHLTPKSDPDEADGEFEQFDIQVDTRLASDPTQEIYADPVASDNLLAAGTAQDMDEIALPDEESLSDGTRETADQTEETEVQDEDADPDEVIPEDAEQQEAGAEDLGTLIGEYDLVYVNGSISGEAATIIKNAEIPCIINNVNTDSSGLGDLADLIKEDDLDGHYVNTFVYFFKNTSENAVDPASLINQQFHENFNENADQDTYEGSEAAAGFEEILSYIESENQYRALGDNSSGDEDGEVSSGKLDPLSKEISQARAVEYIINYKYKRNISTKEKVNVLEIMPDSDSSQINKDTVKGWLKEESRIDSVDVCCYHSGNEGDKLWDGLPGSMWHSVWGNDGKSHDWNNDPRHYITVTFQKPEDISGFTYQARSDYVSGTGSSNGVLAKYTVVCLDSNGQEVYREDNTTVNPAISSTEVRSFKFNKTASKVKTFRLYFMDSQGDSYYKYQNASCAELDFLYDDQKQDGNKDINIKVNSMTASEFVGHIDDIGSEYDMIYIGDKKKSSPNTYITGTGDYRYVHVGNGKMLPKSTGKNELQKLLGQLDTDYDQNWSQTKSDGTVIRRFAPMSTYSEDGSGYFRGSGNDMTEQQYNELMDFVKSGYPVVLAKGLVSNGTANASEVDASSWYYQFINDALKYDNVMTDESLSGDTKDLKFYTNLAKPWIHFDEKDGKPVEPKRMNDTDTTGTGYIDGELKYTFTVENDSEAAPASNTYDCKLYIDLNFDGNLSKSEAQDNYMTIQDADGNVLTRTEGTDGTSHYELKVGKKYTVTRKIPSDYFKIITWKLELVSNSNSYIHTSETGYAKQQNRGTPQTINVLQLVPKNCTWTLATNTKFNSKLNALESQEGFKDFKINLSSLNVSAIGKMTEAEMASRLSDVQMLIIGFADVYDDIPNNNNQVNAILDFVRSGKSVIFAHDTTSYINYKYNEMYNKIAFDSYPASGDPSWGNYASVYYDDYLHRWDIDNVTWGYSLNTVLRSVVGMDRYGITSDAQIGDETVSQLLKKGQVLDSSSVNFQDLMEIAGDVAYKNGDKTQSYAQTQGYTNPLIDGKQLGGPDTTTYKATKVNDGAITQYPYRMPDDRAISIAATHGQYYQLGLEQDNDINGRSDDKNDVVVWYCLTDSIYGASPNDVRNNYYFYSKGNVIYTGAGHSTVQDEDEINLFINAIVAAANVTAVQPEVQFVKTLNPAAEAESTRYYMTDQSKWTEGDPNTLEQSMDFYINVKDYNMVSADLSEADLSKQKMSVEFFIEDENGSEVQISGNETRKLTNITSRIGQLTEYGTGAVTSVSGDRFELTQNNAYGFTVPDIEQYLRTSGFDYKENCKLYVKVSSTVYLYGQPKESTSWSYVDLKQRQLFEMD